MNVRRGAQAGQAGSVTIACINKATVNPGVDFDKLDGCAGRSAMILISCPFGGYPVRLYNTKVAKPSDWQFVYLMTPIWPASSAIMS